MAVTGQTLTVFRGSAAVLNFSVGTPTNITGWTIVLTVARALGSGSKAITQQVAVHVSDLLGDYRFDLTAAMTDIRPAPYYFDVWRIDAGAEEFLASGVLTIEDVVRLPTS